MTPFRSVQPQETLSWQIFPLVMAKASGIEGLLIRYIVKASLCSMEQ
jgi:hypothetical protein